MSEEFFTFCPFSQDSKCHIKDCMLFLVSADPDTLRRSKSGEGFGCCSIAAIASHISSEKHYGGNYLMTLIKFKFGIADDESE